MNVFDDLRLRQHQQIIAAFERLGMGGKAGTAKIFLVESIPLDGRAHGAVEDQNSLGQQLCQNFFGAGNQVSLHGLNSLAKSLQSRVS